MKIIINLNTTWNIYNFRMGLAKSLQEEGHEVIAMAPRDEYVSKLEELGMQCFHIEIDQKGVNPIKDLLIIKS